MVLVEEVGTDPSLLKFPLENGNTVFGWNVECDSLGEETSQP